MKWRIYYEDGSVYSDADGRPEDSPAWGAVAVGQLADGAFRDRLINGHAYLYRTDMGCWMEVVDEAGFLDQLVHNADSISVVRIGRYIRKDDWQAICGRVAADLNG